MKHPNPDILLMIALGDAYGAGFEFANKQFREKHHTFTGYVQNPRYDELCPGMYTDDTQMSIALAEVLVEGLSDDYETHHQIANKFVEVYQRDRRKVYGRRIQEVLDTVSTGTEFIERASVLSVGNGTAMRSVPLGVMSLGRLVLLADIQAFLTHREHGIQPSILVAAISHFALYKDQPFSSMADYLYQHLLPYVRSCLDHMTLPWHGGIVPCDGSETVRAVYNILIQSSSLQEVLDRAIRMGGDTDSVAAIALGIASSRLPNDLPEFLERDLEPGGKYGVEFLRGLGAQLMEKYAK